MVRSEATKSPVIIPDNLVKADRTKDVLNFLLLGATSAINQKRDSNMDILNDWLNELHDLAFATYRDTDPILYRMEIILDECCQLKDQFSEAYGLPSVKIFRRVDDKISKIRFIL